MLSGYTKKTNIWAGLGILLQILGFAICMAAASTHSQAIALLGILTLVVGQALFIVGCCNYAIGKGYTGVLGMLGLFGLPGLLILAFLSDKHPVVKTLDFEQKKAA